MKPSEANEETLLEPATDPIETLEVLVDRCLAALTGLVWQTCFWPDASGLSTVGDFRFSIAHFEPVPGVSLFIQIWSEPDEPVLMEVSSGNWNPRALKYVWRRQRQILEQRGFVLGGAARDYQKELAVSSPEEAEAVAQEMLAIFFDVFGYRAEQALMMTLERGSRSEQRPVHTSLSPEDFAKIAEQIGFRATLVVTEPQTPVVTLTRGPFKSIAIFGSPIPRRNLFHAVLLRATIRGTPPMSLLDDADEFSTARFVLDSSGGITAEMPLRFDGGVTTEWVANGLKQWRRAVKNYQRLAKSSSGAAVRRLGTIKRRMSVH